MKKEEEKRSELQLQYTRDRCAWELEKAELKCRIAQLEAREATGSVSGGLQSAAGIGPVTNGETPTLRREREEQRRILADTRSTAMDLRCRLDHNERDWLREKAELLERFDVERREWECQLKDMQRKIEELYCEVRSNRGGAAALDSMKQDDDAVHQLSMRSTSTGSSLLSDNSQSELLSSSTQSEPTRNPPSLGLGPTRNTGMDSLHGFNLDVQFSQSGPSQAELLVVEPRARETWKQDSSADNKKAGGTTELEDFYCGAAGHVAPREYVSIGNENGIHGISPECPFWAGLSYGSEKKKNTTALNAALKEIARVSEELCSYQDEIRKKSGDKRNQSESHEKSFLQAEEDPCDLGQIYDDLRALQRENWITLSPSTWRDNRSSSDTWMANTPDPYCYRDTERNPDEHCDMETAAPPIPPRTSSWNLNSSNPDTELHIPESPMGTVRKCHSPCVLMDRKCNSPSIVRKFEAMLQENEGKVFKDGVLKPCSTPSNCDCNKSCCHNRWSCDAGKLTHSAPPKLSTYGTFQKSFSEVNILTAGKDLCPEKNLDVKQLQMFPVIQEFPVDSVPHDIQSVSPSLQGSRRNLMLERKTAEFNRTLFQAEMGRGVDVQDHYTGSETLSEACKPVLATSGHILPPKDITSPSIDSDVSTNTTDSHPAESSLASISNSTIQNTEVEAMQMRCATKVQEVKMKPKTLSLEEPHPGLREAPKPSQSSHRQSEVKHKLQKTDSFSRKSRQRSTHQPPSPLNTQPDESVARDDPHQEKPQTARAGVSILQVSAESKKSPATRQRSDSPYQSNSSRLVPRIMNDHPWKPLTLAAYPRPEGSRSNYGAVERILKNYESAARAQQNEIVSNPTELDMLDMASLPSSLTLRDMQTSPTAQAHCPTVQVSFHSVNERELKVQEDEEPSVTPPSIQKSFSRPARPGNRRLPSRWASRSPTSSSSPSSSPCTTPVIPTSFPLQKHSSSFTYTHGFHIETVII